MLGHRSPFSCEMSSMLFSSIISSSGVSSLSHMLSVSNSIRVNAPVVQEWPWENGLPLEHGSMESMLRKSLGVHSSDEPEEPALVEMVLVSLALHVILLGTNG